MATRSRNLIWVVAIEAPFDSLTGIHIDKGTRFLQAGDGFVITSLVERCEPGPIDTEEERPRPTVYLQGTISSNPCTFIEELPQG